MTNQTKQAQLFKALHQAGNPVVLFNVWDAGSAKAVASSGAKAIATGSAPVAMANGFPDGEQFPLDDALIVASRILNVIDLPLSMDLEGGYGESADEVANTVRRAMRVGAVGFNVEDQIVGGSGLYSVDEQSKRIQAARAAADENGVHGFLNARTDIFLKTKPDEHTDAMVNNAIERAKAYEQAGADGFFAPGMVNEAQIETLCKAVALPINMIVLPHTPTLATFTELGAARISYGPTPYRSMISWLQGEAATIYGQA